MTTLKGLLEERPEIAGAAHVLLARVLWETGPLDADKLKEIEEHRRQAEVLRPETAEAYFLRAMTAVTIPEQLAALNRALALDSRHYESRRLRAFTFYASRKYGQMSEDASVMQALRDHDPLGYSLRATALRELGRCEEALAEYDRAMSLAGQRDAQYLDLVIQRSEVLLRMGSYERIVAEAQAHASSGRTKDISPLQYHLFCALTTLGDYEKADSLSRQIIGLGQDVRGQFQNWCAKYVFDSLHAGRAWHPPDRAPVGAAFLPMVEAQETYRELSAKARRIVPDGFGAEWSPDGKKLAFSLGVQGYSGVAVYDPATRQTDLLIVPGKNPRWSPDGRYLAFVRDGQLLRVPEFFDLERKDQYRTLAQEEVWLMKSDGSEPRRLVRGGSPTWDRNSTSLYFHSRQDYALYLISIADRDAEPKRIMACSDEFPSLSPDDQRVAYLDGTALKVKDLAAQTLIAEWPAPPGVLSGHTWSPRGDELCVGGSSLWIYRFGVKEPLRILGDQIRVGSWAPDAGRFVFSLGAPHYEIWAADVASPRSTLEALGPGRTLAEHFRERTAFFTRRIEADLLDAENYLHRAGQYQYPRDDVKVRADMRRYWAILNQGFFSDSGLQGPWTFVRALTGLFGRQLVVFLEKQEDGLCVLRLAFGPRGRHERKPYEIPLIGTSVLGPYLLSGLEPPPARADFTFGEPVSLGPTVNSTGSNCGPCLSADGLELYFHREEPDGEIRVARRAAPDAEWGPSASLGSTVNSPSYDGGPWLSANGLSLYFFSDRPGGFGTIDIWVTTRATTNDHWAAPVNLGPPVNTSSDDWSPSLSADGLELYFTSGRSGGYGNWDLWVATRPTVNDNWSTPINLGPRINTGAQENWPGVSPDGLLLFFASNRPGGVGSWDLYVAHRATKKAPWGPAVNLGSPVNSTSWEVGSRVSPDGSTLYFHSPRPGGFSGCDIWHAPIIRRVDIQGNDRMPAADPLVLSSSSPREDKKMGTTTNCLRAERKV